MQMENEMQYCIDQCTKAGQIIRNTANDMVDHRARLALAEANRHIEMCVHSCLDAKEMAKTNNMAAARY